LVIKTNDGTEFHFEVVGLVEDEDGRAFAVCYNDDADEFVVTDGNGKLLEDSRLAQEVLDDFFALAEESASADGEAST
jgi:argonaute-like protein implicated in RNA metabolism and viral defense